MNPGADFAPEFAAPRAVPRVTAVRNAAGAAYEGASTKRRLAGWNAPTVGPNRSSITHLATLRDRSRSLARNNGWAKGVVDKHVINLIGTGIKPQPQLADEGLREQLTAFFDRWTAQSDADGLLDWYGQQTQATRCWKEAGEVFLRLRPRLPSDGLIVPLQVQVLEPELCPLNKTESAGLGRHIRNGIEYDAIGRRTAYYFHPSRVEHDDDYDESELRRVPADAVIHCYQPLRAGQRRGLPELTQALVKLYTLDKCDDAELVRQHLQNLFAGFITRPSDDGADPVHPVTGEPAPTSTAGELPALTLQPGIMQELEPGEAITFSEPPGTSGGYEKFMRQQLLGVAAATGVPYEVFSGDLSGLNDRIVRVILNEFRRLLQAEQHQIIAHQICWRVWRAWVERVWMANVLPVPLDYVLYPAVRWMPQGWPYIHPVQDVQAANLEIRTGLASRRQKVSERGDDVEIIDEEQAADNARADRLKLKYDSDGRQQLVKKGAGATL